MKRTFEHTFPFTIIFLFVHLNLSFSQVIAVWNNDGNDIIGTCNSTAASIVTKPTTATKINFYSVDAVSDSSHSSFDLFDPTNFNMLDPFFILLGFGTANYHGAINANEKIFSDAAAMHFINLQVGYSVGSPNVSRKKLMLRLFGAFGYSNPIAVTKTQLQQGFISEKNFRVDSGTFWEIEGGVVLNDLFRASIGWGSQELSVQSFDVIHVSDFSYWIATVGVLQHVANIEVGILGSVMFGELYKRTSARFAFCFGFYF